MARRTRLQQPQTKPENSPVKVIRKGIDSLNPDVREAALKLAGNDPSLIEVRSESEAVVHGR